MKSLIAVLVILTVFLKWDSISDFMTSSPDFAAAHGGKVILYSTSWCSSCVETRKFLEANDIAYYEYDIEKSQEGRSQYKVLGGRVVPLLLINRKVIVGYRPDDILKFAN